MPGSWTTQGRRPLANHAGGRVAFRWVNGVGTPIGVFRGSIACPGEGRGLACTLPYRRFVQTVAGQDARLGADAGRYSFIAVDLHHLLLASLPADLCENC